MDFNIKYPTLVEQSYEFMKQLKPDITKQEVYLQMVESNLIDEDGNPTEFAIKNQLVSVGQAPQSDQQPDQQLTQEDIDTQNVFKYMNPNDVINADDPDKCQIKTVPLIKAIKQALKDGSLSMQGRKSWSKTLNDLEQSLKK
ncbi:hypothetical protein [Lactobacillus helveticus]|uniref:hypothetical protein n=1 Tax=Lactobacillus helveticus TaxID=1587 RepID=UPI00156261D6|nr:hypothetical protein [Lactobacillus helveticus]NRO09090.1 hypothetical protein [Lactobacillus helveticus]